MADTEPKRLHDLELRVGMRVRLIQDADIYPLGLIPAGSTGAVLRVWPNYHELLAEVKLDQPLDFLAEWDNELQIRHEALGDYGLEEVG